MAVLTYNARHSADPDPGSRIGWEVRLRLETPSWISDREIWTDRGRSRYRLRTLKNVKSFELTRAGGAHLEAHGVEIKFGDLGMFG